MHADFPGGPVFETLCFYCRGHGSIPGWGIKIPHAMQRGQKKTKTNKLHRFFNGNYELALGSSEILMISECVVLPRGKVWKR